VLLAGQVLEQHKAAWLIDHAVAGVVDLAPDDSPAHEMTMIRLQSGGPVTDPLLDIAFRGRDRLTLGAYDRDFARRWDALGRRLSAWPGASGLWDADADRRARWIQVAGTWPGWPGWPCRSSPATSPRGRPVFPWCWPASAVRWPVPARRPRSGAGSCGCSPLRDRQPGCRSSRCDSSSRSRR
jgi:hypothetical protein